jgi:hypothetical protein
MMRANLEHQFQYEIMCETHPELKPLVTNTWGAGGTCDNVQSIQEKLETLSSTLGVWNRDTFGSVRKEIKQLKRELEGLQSASGRTINPRKRKNGLLNVWLNFTIWKRLCGSSSLGLIGSHRVTKTHGISIKEQANKRGRTV